VSVSLVEQRPTHIITTPTRQTTNAIAHAKTIAARLTSTIPPSTRMLRLPE